MTPEQNTLLTTIDTALATIRTTAASAETAAASLRATLTEAPPAPSPAPSPAPTGDLTLTLDSTNPYTPKTTPTIAIVNLHASSAGSIPYLTRQGHVYRADCTGALANAQSASFYVSAVDYYWGTNICPRDSGFYGNLQKEYLHCGWSASAGQPFDAILERRWLAAIPKVLALYPQIDAKRIVWYGESMGAWGVMRIAIKRPDLCSLIVASRPRWRSTNTAGQVAMPTWDTSGNTYPIDSAPPLSAADGGITARAHFDLIQYVQNTAARIPPVIWCVGRNDGYTPFAEHVEAVAALRARRVPFQFGWNNGDHSTGHIVSSLGTDHYGDFRTDRGSVLFENCSRDQNPSVDQSGFINKGLRFRNVIETATSFSAEVTCLDGPATVNVSPYSALFTSAVSPLPVNIPAAGAWVSVSFS